MADDGGKEIEKVFFFFYRDIAVKFQVATITVIILANILSGGVSYVD